MSERRGERRHWVGFSMLFIGAVAVVGGGIAYVEGTQPQEVGPVIVYPVTAEDIGHYDLMVIENCMRIGGLALGEFDATDSENATIVRRGDAVLASAALMLPDDVAEIHCVSNRIPKFNNLG